MSSTTMKDGTKVFLFVSVFFGIIIFVNILLIYLSIKTNDGLVEENYYTRGLNYQEEINNENTQKKLDWKVVFDNKSNLYKVSVIDKKAKPIKDAKVNLVFFRPTQSGFDKTLKLNEISLGTYQSEIQLPLKGIWDIIINIEKGTDKWKKKQRITVN